MLTTVLIHAIPTPGGIVVHFTTNGTPGDYLMPAGTPYSISGQEGGKSLTLLIYGDAEQPARPTFAAISSPVVWRTILSLLHPEAGP